MSDEEATIRAAVKVLVGAMLDLLQEDGHHWSNRPCQTCTAISGLAGRPFGCVKFAQDKGSR